MKAKTIRKVLRKKIDGWAESITNSVVKDLVLKNTIVTGGCIPSMLLQEEPNDYDIYFKDKATAHVVAEYYVKEYIKKNNPSIIPKVIVVDDQVKIVIQSAGVTGEETDDTNYQYYETLPDENLEGSDYVEGAALSSGSGGGTKYRPVFLSANAITLSDQIQIVLRFYGTPEQIHENYDFTHCTNWWDSYSNHLELRKEALEAILTKELRYQGSKYPLCSIIRTRKFINRGWQINAGQYLKMCMQLNELDLTDVKVLEDQLTGVDVAYFYQVIRYIKDSNKDITTTYLCEIIDRIF